MSKEPDDDHLYETAESQASYFTASQARDQGFSWKRPCQCMAAEVQLEQRSIQEALVTLEWFLDPVLSSKQIGWWNLLYRGWQQRYSDSFCLTV